jgi:hypothetical protein
MEVPSVIYNQKLILPMADGGTIQIFSPLQEKAWKRRKHEHGMVGGMKIL